ncbi:Pectinesterase-2 precursor [Cinnamomum micranthum f. kanehirae]|uniref:Pectinesterase-2 n=1 Tax=Cinnamomum micranthum f. kanehirae TaxID=337451 RepID=A0A3S3P142_9MAGN|nr:Pectinesterase-2 precursor [Cinnamomum micranthum f. kanehirae]
MQSIMDSLVDSSGWLNETTNISTLYYGEYNNTGPGSKLDKKVRWPGYHAYMNDVDAINFFVSNFISAIVNSIVKRESVVIDQHGLGNFTTIRETLAVTPQ